MGPKVYPSGMPTDHDAILEKVKKLLALSRSPSEAEAAAALGKARELLARYGLKVAGLNPDDPATWDHNNQDSSLARGVISEAVLMEKKRLRGWESVLLSAVGSACFTDVLHYRTKTEGKILLVGREVNLISARELFLYLHKTILIAGRQNKDRVPHVESFRRGMAQRIAHRLATQPSPEGGAEGSKDLVSQMTALSDKENKGYIREKYGKTGKKRSGRRVDWQSYQRGLAAGEKVSLDQQIDSP
jgi:hypothetical protein